MSWYGHYPPPPADYGAPGYGAPGAGAGAAPSGYPAPPPGPPSHAYPAAPAYGAPPPGAYYHHQQPPPPPQPPQQPQQPHAYAPPYGYAHQYPGPAAYHRGAAPYAQPPLPAVAQQQAHYSMSPPPTGASPAPPPPLKEGELRPPPDVAHDPNSFRRYFKQQLDLLTYNSKPVITSLTLFAHEHAVRMAAVVSQCFDEHLRTVSSNLGSSVFHVGRRIQRNVLQNHTGLLPPRACRKTSPPATSGKHSEDLRRPVSGVRLAFSSSSRLSLATVSLCSRSAALSGDPAPVPSLAMQGLCFLPRPLRSPVLPPRGLSRSARPA